MASSADDEPAMPAKVQPMIAKNKVRRAKKVRRTFVAMRQDSPIAIGNFFVSEACFAAKADRHERQVPGSPRSANVLKSRNETFASH